MAKARDIPDLEAGASLSPRQCATGLQVGHHAGSVASGLLPGGQVAPACHCGLARRAA